MAKELAFAVVGRRKRDEPQPLADTIQDQDLIVFLSEWARSSDRSPRKSSLVPSATKKLAKRFEALKKTATGNADVRNHRAVDHLTQLRVRLATRAVWITRSVTMPSRSRIRSGMRHRVEPSCCLGGGRPDPVIGAYSAGPSIPCDADHVNATIGLCDSCVTVRHPINGRRWTSVDSRRVAQYRCGSRIWLWEPAGVEGLEPSTYGFGDRRSTN